MGSAFTTFCLNDEGQVIYTYGESEDLEKAIQVGKEMLEQRDDAQYAMVIENVVVRHGRMITFDVQFKWHGAKDK